VEYLLFIILVCSVLLNLFLFLYIRWILTEYENLNTNLEDLFAELSYYENHIEEIHNSQMFYGDATLQGLMEHTKKLSENIVEYRNYLFPDDPKEEYETSNNEETKEN